MADEVLQETISVLSKELVNWSDRSPALVVSALQDYSIASIFEIISETPYANQEDFLVQTLANLILSRYGESDSYIEELHNQLTQVFSGDDKGLPFAIGVLEKIRSISYSLQHSASSFVKNQSTYSEINKLVTAFIEKTNHLNLVKPATLNLDKRKPAKTKELEDDMPPVTLSRASETGPLKKSTQNNLRHHTAPTILTGQIQSLVIDVSKIKDFVERREELLFWLPRIYGLLDSWDIEQSPMQMAELLEPLSMREIIQYCSYVLPHKNQAYFMNALGVIIHLNHLLPQSLPLIPEHLEQLYTFDEHQITRILPQLLYRLFCMSTAFYAIQEQAIKKIGFQRNYLYHLITLEWSKNKLITKNLASHPTQGVTSQIQHLETSDWEFIFSLLNQGIGKSVIKDVYGVFHGTSVFAHKIVAPETSVGFGQTAIGTSFAFTTQQISNILAKHGQMTFEISDRTVLFQQYVQENFRKLVAKESRPLLNAPTMTRIEQYIRMVFKRGSEKFLSYEIIINLALEECLSHFDHLASDQYGWLAYDLTTDILTVAQEQDARLDECIKGLVDAILSYLSQVIYRQRPVEAEAIFHYTWDGVFYSLEDLGFYDFHSPQLTNTMKKLALDSIQKTSHINLQEARKYKFEALFNRSD